MAIFQNLSFHRAEKHRGEHGNTVTDALKVVIPATAEVGDVIEVDTGPRDLTYTSIKLQREGLTAGLTVDVGVRANIGEFEDATYFAAASPLTADGTTELLPNGPAYVLDADNRKCEHVLYVTLRGTVTPGESFFLTSEKIAHGAPAG